MYYKSTRDSSVRVESAVAISQGISADGGLFVPEQIPSITKEELAALADKTYAQRAAFVFSRYLTDFTEAELVTAPKVLITPSGLKQKISQKLHTSLKALTCSNCGMAQPVHSRIWHCRFCRIS